MYLTVMASGLGFSTFSTLATAAAAAALRMIAIQYRRLICRLTASFSATRRLTY